MKKIYTFILLLLSTSNYLLAQEDAGFSFEVGLDLYYAYDFNEPIDRSRQYVTVEARHNEFNLNWGFLKGSYQSKSVRGNLALHTGTYPIFNYANEPSDVIKLIAEANAGVKISDKVWIDIGIMPSHIGYENTFSFHNEMYTHSFMAEHTPYFSTGVQLSAALTEKLDFKFVVLNGWQNIIETNNSKSVGINFSYRPQDNLELVYSNYLGNESTNPDVKKIRFYNHFYGKYIFNDQWHSVLSFDYGTQELINSTERGNIIAFLAITQYKINSKFHTAARLEHFNDSKEILVGTGTPNGFTNTNLGIVFDYIPVDMAKLRIEARYYSAPDEIFNAGANNNANNLLIVGSLAINFRKD